MEQSVPMTTDTCDLLMFQYYRCMCLEQGGQEMWQWAGREAGEAGKRRAHC